MKEEVKKWIERAKEDLKAAENSFKSKDYNWASFQAQQSAEKAFKALLIKQTGKFPKIHDLVKLSILVKAPKDIITDSGRLNPTYIETKYPDLNKSYSEKDLVEFIDTAKNILSWIEKNL